MTWLPKDYSFTIPAHHTPQTAAAIGFRDYGGADRSTAVDGAGRRYRSCCAWKDKTKLIAGEVEFGSRIFVEQPGGAYVEVVYWDATHPFCKGRGEINTQGDYDFVIDESGADSVGHIPGWVDVTPGLSRPPITVEAGTPIYQLYLGQYASDAELHSPPGEYVRINKQLLALRQLVAILETQGIIQRG